jgi:hypothetical protein
MAIAGPWPDAVHGEDAKQDVRPSIPGGREQADAEKLRSLSRRITQERRALAETERRWEQERAEMDSRLLGAQSRMAVLARRLEKVSDKQKKLTARKAELVQKRVVLRARLRGIREAIRNGAAALIGKISASLPWRHDERRAAVEKVSERTRAADTDVSTLFRLLWERLSDESALIRTIETGELEVRSAQKPKVLPALRVGRTIVLLFDEKGERALLRWADKNGASRQMEVTGVHAKNVHTALRIAQRKRAPALVPLPLPRELIRMGDGPSKKINNQASSGGLK